MPFGDYEDFADCVRKNQGKRNPAAYCAAIQRAIEGKGHMQLGAQNEDKRLILDLEVFAAGFWVPSEGESRFWTTDDLDMMVEAFDAKVPGTVHAKLGHTSPEFTQAVASALGVPVEAVIGEGEEGSGQISLGEVISLRRHGDRLVADLEVPDAMAQLLMKGYNQVSVEMLQDKQGYAWVLSDVAFLGAERPAVEDLNGLAKAAVLTGKRPTVVYAFKAQDGALVLDPVELGEIERALEEAVRGKKTAPFIRQTWNEIKARFQKVLGKAPEEMAEYAVRDPASVCGYLWFHGSAAQRGGFGNGAEGRGPGEKPPKAWWDDCMGKISASEHRYEEVKVNFKELGKRLQFAEGISDEDIVAVIEQATGMLGELRKAMGMPAEAPVAEVAAKAKEQLTLATEAKGQLATFSEQLAALSRENRAHHFREQVATLTAIQGTPEELAGKLVVIEEKMGAPAATERLAEWRKAQEFAVAAGLLTKMGSSKNGAPDSEYAMKLTEYRAAGLSMPKAVTKLSKEYPALFRQYQADNLVVKANDAGGA